MISDQWDITNYVKEKLELYKISDWEIGVVRYGNRVKIKFAEKYRDTCKSLTNKSIVNKCKNWIQTFKLKI